jgi:hypothetical protein
MMMRAVNRAFQLAPKAFDAVGVNVPAWLSDAKWLPRSIYPYTIDGVCYDFAEDGWPTVNGQRGNIVEL